MPYVPTPTDVVNKMLEITNVGPGDYVIDLGSGDGRIVIAAAQLGAVGHGIDLNPVRVIEARENAKKAGVENKVVFLEGDLFKTDFSQASVITMYLLSSVNLRLRPILLKELRPGTRIVSHSFSMGDWEPDQHKKVDGRSVYYWVIPAPVQGRWEWTSEGEKFNMEISQEFQKINIKASSSANALEIRDPVLSGDRIGFLAYDRQTGKRYVFNGRVENNLITGTAQIHHSRVDIIETWTATLR